MFAKTVRHSLVAHRLVLGLMLLAFATIASQSARAQPAVIGKWDKKFDWPNAGIHVHVLPTGKVLFWGRRDKGPGLDPHETTPYLWDPGKPDMTGFTKLEQPKNKKGDKLPQDLAELLSLASRLGGVEKLEEYVTALKQVR